MIERGHEHRFTPVSVFDRDDGVRVIHSRCDSQPPTPSNPTPCAMEEQRIFEGGRCTGIKFRIHGVWFHPFDLLRSLPSLGVQECSACGGEELLAPCEACGGLGVEADGGGPLVAPDLHVHA